MAGETGAKRCHGVVIDGALLVMRGSMYWTVIGGARHIDVQRACYEETVGRNENKHPRILSSK